MFFSSDVFSELECDKILFEKPVGIFILIEAIRVTGLQSQLLI